MDKIPSSNGARSGPRGKTSPRSPSSPSGTARTQFPLRKYSITYLTPDNQINELTREAPAIASFEDAFGALGHGAIVQTKAGPMAVEDLLPGDEIRLANMQYDKLLWRGSMTVDPARPCADAAQHSLTRITAEALGPNRPSPDLILGPTARLLHRSPGIRTLTGRGSAFLPMRDFLDGINIIELRPAAPVRVYQLGFERHQSLSVNGVEIESLHPGTAFALGLRGDMLAQYLALFPHKIDLEDFGDMKSPRLRLRDLELLDGI
ncbi:Hint domain-containing protein [Yoonia sp. BS5-3]|uniref:Hint domain-containing protein n=1 Tax=Yoonia phaeophyticola TaxID=3137369 RepID=A0ABZ2V993_9RHOB